MLSKAEGGAIASVRLHTRSPRLKIILILIIVLICAASHSLSSAQTYGGLPIPGLSADPRTQGVQSVGFWDQLFRWGGQDETPKKNLRRPNDETTRIRPNETVRIRPNGSFVAAMAPASPKRVAALRFAEKGRRLLADGAYQSALIYFEKALSLDANPYFYYYLARAHYHLAHTQDSLRFLEVAESFLTEQRDWIAEVQALRGKFDSARSPASGNVRPVSLR
jgi:hypothetical protein